MWKHVYSVCLISACLTGLWNCTPKPAKIADAEGSSHVRTDEGPSPARTPAEELASFQLQPGLQIQLVAAEPMVQDPVVITFDEDGRLWVVEMRGFMTTIDAAGENEPTGRISVLEDTNGDGQMDKSTIYLDSLIMPRALALVPGGALVAENQALWLTQDINGDLKADSKTLIDKEYAGSALPEHSGNGLWRGMDNWYYNAKSRLRYRLINGEWQRDSTEFRGQWGISHDDEGRLIYNYNWSQLHADLVPPNYLSRNKNHTATTGIDHGLTTDRRIYPIRPNPAVNRGYIPGTLDEEGKLLEFTAACSPLYYRGTALPREFYGNVFVCEPSGNLIKRNVVKENGLLLSAYDPIPGKEFLASTDERFRPVHLATGPDGALYVADMYRGLVQHGAYITPYLREQTLLRKLVLPVHRGRIWRIVPKNWNPTKPKKLSKASSTQLVALLFDSNGWYRDMAQRLLVERKDTSIKKTLIDFALAGNNDHGGLHALWALEGMNMLDPELLLTLLSEQNTLVWTTALRLLESIAKEDQQVRLKLEEVLLKTYSQAPIKQSLQMALSAPALDEKAGHTLLAGIISIHDSSALIRDAVMSSLYNQEFAFLKQLWQHPAWQTQQASREIFLEMLTTAIVRKRDATELTQLLALLDANKGTFGWKEKAVLTGMSMGGGNSKAEPVKLSTAPAILSRTDLGLEPSRLTALAVLFEWPGHAAVKNNLEKKNPLSEEEQKLFALGRQHYLTTCAGCHGTDGAGLNRFAPPLAGSQWVTGDEQRLALIVLHGMEGPLEVNGKTYNTPDILPVMPAHTTLDDEAITAILTYIRNEWGNEAGPVSRRTVSTTRNTSQGRVIPWTAAELDKYIQENKATTGK
jgi:mono/diheme cytochrome c family protein/glucose/arabinose dehydrogenase